MKITVSGMVVPDGNGEYNDQEDFDVEVSAIGLFMSAHDARDFVDTLDPYERYIVAKVGKE